MTPRPLAIVWRGPLDSCNYDCSYCPFAKREPVPRVLEADRAALERFVRWVDTATGWSLEILFTPYGEGLVWPWYRAALAHLSRLPHVRRVAIQTNGRAPMGFLGDADRSRLALWVTWHPSEISLERFTATIVDLHERGTRLSVGAVAVPANLEAVEALRAALPPAVPMWINALKPGGRYDDDAIARWSAIDPGFELDRRPPSSRGVACHAGDTVISVDGPGTVRRCHFVDTILGNLYVDDLASRLGPAPCPRARCDCFIGYSHRVDLDLRRVYGEDLLARIRTF